MRWLKLQILQWNKLLHSHELCVQLESKVHSYPTRRKRWPTPYNWKNISCSQTCLFTLLQHILDTRPVSSELYPLMFSHMTSTQICGFRRNISHAVSSCVLQLCVIHTPDQLFIEHVAKEWYRSTEWYEHTLAVLSPGINSLTLYQPVKHIYAMRAWLLSLHKPKVHIWRL